MKRSTRSGVLGMLLVGLGVAGCGSQEAPAALDVNHGATGASYCPNLACSSSDACCTSDSSCASPRCIAVPSGLAAPVQWWTDSRTTNVSSSGVAACPSAYDIDNGYIHGSNVIVLPHDSEYLGDNSSYAYTTCTGAWGFGPNFYDTVTHVRFHLNHIRPGSPLASLPVGTMLKAGSFVGLSGGDTCETGYCSNGYPY